METTRQQKIAKLIQRDLAGVFQKECRHLLSGTLVTVTKVQVTRDLSIAKVYLSLFATNNNKTVVETLQKNVKEIRFNLGQRVHNQLRVIPELHFYEDDSLDYIENIEKLLDE